MTGDPFFLLQPQHFLDTVLQTFSNFFARSMHGQRGDIGAQADRQVAALAGFKRASLLFEPPFELGAGHIILRQYNRCVVLSIARWVLYPSNSVWPSSKRLAPYFMPPAVPATHGSGAPRCMRAKGRNAARKPACRYGGTRPALACGSRSTRGRTSSLTPSCSFLRPSRCARLRCGLRLRRRCRAFRESRPCSPRRAAVPCAWASLLTTSSAASRHSARWGALELSA